MKWIRVREGESSMELFFEAITQTAARLGVKYEFSRSGMRWWSRRVFSIWRENSWVEVPCTYSAIEDPQSHGCWPWRQQRGSCSCCQCCNSSGHSFRRLLFLSNLCSVFEHLAGPCQAGLLNEVSAQPVFFSCPALSKCTGIIPRWWNVFLKKTF